MLRRNGCAICLLLTLWVCFPTPATSGQLLTEDGIDSMIPSDAFFQGSEVRVLVKGVMAEAHKAIRATAAEAVKEAVIPLMAELAGERVKSATWEAAWREERAGGALGRVLFFGGAALLVFVGGAALGATVF
jgi:hypothetical protein